MSICLRRCSSYILKSLFYWPVAFASVYWKSESGQFKHFDYMNAFPSPNVLWVVKEDGDSTNYQLHLGKGNLNWAQGNRKLEYRKT